MKQLSASQIAAALAGHPFGSGPELRLLMLFQSDAGDRAEVEPELGAGPLARAA